jgi:hypothetical protein
MFPKNALNKYILMFVTVIMLTSCVPQTAQSLGTTTPIPESNTTLPAPKPTATAPGGFPVGTYKPDNMLFTLIQFSADSTFVLEVAGDRHQGRYDVSGDQIVLNTYDGVCAGYPGTYQWKMDGNTLLLKPINETCTGSPRSEDLGSRSWILQPPTTNALGGFRAGTYKPDQVLYTYSVQFNADGSFVDDLSGDLHHGHYDVNGDQILLNAADGVCIDHPGTYQWKIDGNTLVLKAINDTCTMSSRQEDLEGRSWILQP